MAKKLNIPTSALQSAERKSEEFAVRNLQESTKAKKRKGSNAYLKLDLMPNGVNLKDYVIERANRLGLENGIKISATRYIQMLIEKDMAKSKNKKNKREQLKEMIESVPDKNLVTLENVIKALIK